MRSLCPRCGFALPGGLPCPRCGHGSRKRSRRTPEQERARKQSNPWRSRYSSAEYKRNCQRALDATGGRCAVSGIRIADMRDGRWVMRPNGGVHHKVPLSRGGTDDVSNLMPLDVKVHNMIDAQRRREERGR